MILKNGLELNVTIVAKDEKVITQREAFKHLITNEGIVATGKVGNGLTLPTMELQFVSSSLKELTEYARDEQILIEVEIGKEVKATTTYKKMNMDIESKGGVYLATMYCVLYNERLTEVATQQAFSDMTSVEVFREALKDVTPLKENNLTTNDKMCWIRANQPLFLFLSDVIKHSCVKDDFLLAGLNTDELRILQFEKDVKPLKEVELSDEKINYLLANHVLKEQKETAPDKKLLHFTNLKVETIGGLFEFLNKQYQQPILNVVDNKVLNAEQKETKTLSTRMDTGSTFKGYWEAEKQNKERLYQLIKNTIFVDIAYTTYNVKPLDIVYLQIPNLIDVGGKIEYEGIAVILGVSEFISHEHQAIQLCIAKC